MAVSINWGSVLWVSHYFGFILGAPDFWKLPHLCLARYRIKAQHAKEHFFSVPRLAFLTLDYVISALGVTALYIYIQIYMYIHVCHAPHININTYIHTYVRTYIHTYVHTYIHLCMHIYIYIDTYACIYKYICMYG